MEETTRIVVPLLEQRIVRLKRRVARLQTLISDAYEELDRAIGVLKAEREQEVLPLWESVASSADEGFPPRPLDMGGIPADGSEPDCAG